MGCEHYSTEDIKLFYDKNGELVGYDLPYTDSSTILDFTLFAGLVPYGMYIQGLYMGVSETSESQNKWKQLKEDFGSLMYSVYQANRSIFPPDPIMVNGKKYEVAAVALCDNYNCNLNKEKTDIDPLPLLLK